MEALAAARLEEIEALAAAREEVTDSLLAAAAALEDDLEAAESNEVVDVIVMVVVVPAARLYTCTAWFPPQASAALALH